MSNLNKGMMISTGGLTLTGEQVISVVSMSNTTHLFVLNQGTLRSYRSDSTSDTGFISSTLANTFTSQALAYLVEGATLVEIAGGSALKARYDNGICLEATVTLGGSFIIGEHKDVARVTKYKMYKITQPAQYYKSGAGTAPLVPLLDGGIIAVFEGVNEDFIVTIDDALANDLGAICGRVGGFIVTGQEGSYTLHTPNGAVGISSFGTLVRKADGVKNILMASTSTNKDYSSVFSPSHYAYIQVHRKDYDSEWVGFGKTGYVVDAPDHVYMSVKAGAGATRAINDEIPIVSKGSTIYTLNQDGSLEPIRTTSLQGQDLINYIYTNDMSEMYALGSVGSGLEAFGAKGYSFSYGAGRMASVTL